MFEDQAIIAEFVTESREHLAVVESLLLVMEAAGQECDSDVVNRVFRAVHSIKGAAGFLGFREIGELTHSLENVLNRMRNRELAPDSQIVDLLLRSTDLVRTMINAICEDRGADNEHDIQPFVNALNRVQDRGIRGSAVPAQRKKVAASPDEPPGATLAASAERAAVGQELQSGDNSIRVPVGLLDKLMNLADEIVLSRNQVLQALGSRPQSGLDTAVGRLEQLTSELQEAIMQTRMQPVAHLFNRFPRLVRDLSAKLGKHVDLQIHAKDVEVDKSIIEAVSDPLLHLVRNSLDHGIETPDIRARRGKPGSGTITLEASQQAGRVNITVRDDGAGIDAGRIRTKAVAKGIVTPEQAANMSDREAIELIFQPGFSTAESITDISGRGVGMDVVKENITRLGGTVEIETRIGYGTEVHVNLPNLISSRPQAVCLSGISASTISWWTPTVKVTSSPSITSSVD